MAVGGARAAGFEARGLKADLADPATAEALAASAREPRLYLLLGNSLGIIDPVEFLKTLRGLLRSDDLLLVDGEIYRPSTTIQGYDNPTNRRFAFAPLASLNLEEGRDGTLVFESETDARLEGLHLVGKHFRAARRLTIPVAGQTVELEAGEKIAMNSSWKYSSLALRKLVQETGRLEFFREYPSQDEAFLMVLAGHPGRRTRQQAGSERARRPSRGANLGRVRPSGGGGKS
jgi:uncharacterized SAM-dependent methyltransferase